MFCAGEGGTRLKEVLRGATVEFENHCATDTDGGVTHARGQPALREQSGMVVLLRGTSTL